MKLKKILAGAMAGAMVLGSLSVVSAETENLNSVTVTNAGWWDAWTSTYEIKDGEFFTLQAEITETAGYVYQSLNAVFVNVATDGTTAPANTSSDYYEYVVLRSDNYGWGDCYSTTTYTGTDYLYTGVSTLEIDSETGDYGTVDYKTLLTGAIYDIIISRDGTTINYDYVITESDGTILNCGYEIEIADLASTDSIYVFFTGDAGVTFTVSEVNGITTDDTAVALTVDGTKDLSSLVSYTSTSIQENGTTTYTVKAGDEAYIEVDETTGEVTGIAKTGTDTNGSVYYATVIVTCVDANSNTYTEEISVQVTDPNSITGVSTSISAASLTVGDTLTVSPSYAAEKAVTDETPITDTYTTTYASSDTGVATVDENGVITAVAEGTATVTITVTGTNTNGDAYTYTAEIAITVTAAAATSTETTESESESESETTESSSSSSNSSSSSSSSSSASDKDTADATPVIPVAIALIGCAVVVFASKKRMA